MRAVPRPHSLLLAGLAVAGLALAPAASAASQTIIDDHSTPTDPGPVFVGHPGSFTGVCPYADAGRELPDGGCRKQYTFTVSEDNSGTADVEVAVDYDIVAEIATGPGCKKGADLDLFLKDDSGNTIRSITGCDAGELAFTEENLPAGNYVVEVRGNWGAVVEYHATGVLSD